MSSVTSSTATAVLAWRAALSSRLRTTRVSCSRRPWTRPAETRAVSTGTRRSCSVSSSTSSSRSISGSDASGCGPAASSRRASSSSSLTVSSMRTSSARARCATAGQSARSALRRATSRFVRIDDRGLRSSCDASDTNWRCLRDDVSSRSSIAFMVRASRPTSSSVSGSGTRRSMVAPVIASASWRIASTGLSARPVKYQAASATRTIIAGTAISRTSVTESTVRSTSSSDCWATSVMRPAWVSIWRCAAS